MFQDTIVPGFCRALRKLAGDHRQKATTPMTLQAYSNLLDQLTFPFNAIVILAWKRAARIMDILEVRHGGLFHGILHSELLQSISSRGLHPVILECPFDKVGRFGLFDTHQLALTSKELRILAPLISSAKPTNPPRDRPLMFPQVSTELVSQAIAKHAPSLTSRSIRRGALQTLIAEGFPLQWCILLSLHKSFNGAMRYVECPDAQTTSKMIQMQFPLSKI